MVFDRMFERIKRRKAESVMCITLQQENEELKGKLKSQDFQRENRGTLIANRAAIILLELKTMNSHNGVISLNSTEIWDKIKDSEGGTGLLHTVNNRWKAVSDVIKKVLSIARAEGLLIEMKRTFGGMLCIEYIPEGNSQQITDVVKSIGEKIESIRNKGKVLTDWAEAHLARLPRDEHKTLNFKQLWEKYCPSCKNSLG